MCPTRRAFNLGRSADHTDEQRDRWADWEPERVNGVLHPQSLSRRNRRAPSAVPAKQTANSKWCLVGNTLETVTLRRVLVSFHLRTVEPTMSNTQSGDRNLTATSTPYTFYEKARKEFMALNARFFSRMAVPVIDFISIISPAPHPSYTHCRPTTRRIPMHGRS